MCKQQQERVRLLQKLIINQFDHYNYGIPFKGALNGLDYSSMVCAHTIVIGTISINLSALIIIIMPWAIIKGANFYKKSE